MTQAFNLSQLGNNVNTSGQVSLTAGVSGTLPNANLPTVDVSHGGTGLTAVGTSGNVLTSNGSAWVSQAAGGSSPTMQVFTASGSYTLPANCKGIFVQVQAAGGGALATTGTTTTVRSTVPAGGGGYAYKQILASAISGAVSVTVGVGALQTAGGTTSFGAFVSATGGGTTGTAGTGSSGNVNIQGQSGLTNAGLGGSAQFGWGGISAANSGVGSNGTGYGGGGGGSKASGSAITPDPNKAGSTGASGIVIVEEFY